MAHAFTVATTNVLFKRAYIVASLDFVLGILALALCAVSCFDFSVCDRFRTAIASIVRAATIVVVVVAVAVALVAWLTAFSRTIRVGFVIWILAFTLV